MKYETIIFLPFFLFLTVQCAHDLKKVDQVPEALTKSEEGEVKIRIGTMNCKGVVLSENTILMPARCVGTSGDPIIKFPDGTEAMATMIATRKHFVLVKVKQTPSGVKPRDISFDSEEFYIAGNDGSWWKGSETPFKGKSSIKVGQPLYASNGNTLGFYGSSLLNKQDHSDPTNEWKQINPLHLTKLLVGLQLPSLSYASVESEDGVYEASGLTPFGTFMAISYRSFGIGANYHGNNYYGYEFFYNFQPAKKYDDIDLAFKPFIGIQSLGGRYRLQSWWSKAGMGLQIGQYWGIGLELLNRDTSSIFQVTWNMWLPIMTMMENFS